MDMHAKMLKEIQVKRFKNFVFGIHSGYPKYLSGRTVNEFNGTM